MEKINLASPDITQENIKRIASLFPDVVTEALDDDGNIVRTIDFDALRQDLSSDIVDGPRERYQFTWPGKQAAKLEARKPCDKTMRPVREESVNWDETENLYIEGDNLEALKIMRETYAGKVKLIYIDPPYNTGHDFIYDDDFAQTRAEYEAESGEFDEGGGRLVANPESNGRFHSDWCSMMYPRLLLARDLLSGDGVVFISVDDNEQGNLRKICDEIFGSSNYLTCITRATGTPTGGGFDGLVNELDYMFVYAKDITRAIIHGLPMSEEDSKIYDQEDEYGRFLTRSLRRTGGEDRREDRPTMYFPIIAPDGTEVYPIGPTGYESRWICAPETVKRMEENHLLAWKKTTRDGIETWHPYQKFYLENRTKAPGNLWTTEEGNKKATRDIRDLFDTVKVFDFPKPIGLIEKVIRIASTCDDIVLDFFSGSATTAHAVMRLNAEDEQRRRFILVQMPELCAAGTEASKAGYENLCQLGEERIRRAGAKIVAEIKQANKQLKLGEEPKPIPDMGFRVFRDDSSNLRDVNLEPTEFNQSTIFEYVDNLIEDRTAEDLLFQVMPKFRIPYSAKYTTSSIAGKTIFNVNDGQLIACFDEDVDETVIEEIAKRKPLYAVFRDASMADDATAANFEELFKTYSPDTIRRVI